MTRSTMLLLVLLAALPAAAQDAAPAGAAKSAAPGDPRALPLFAEARAGIKDLPEPIATLETMDLAVGEVMHYKAESARDFVAAFNAAQALNGPSSPDDRVGELRVQVRNQVIGFSLMFLGKSDMAQAVELVRHATPPAGEHEADLYDHLLAFPDKTRTPERTLALIHECVRTDGSFPLVAAATLLANKSFTGLERTALVRDGYAAAEKEPTSYTAIAFAGAGHRAAPELDSTLAGLLADMVTALGKDDNPTDKSLNALRANGILRLLTQIDPTRAQALKTQFPAFAAPASPPSMGGFSVKPNAAGDDVNISGPPAFEVVMRAMNGKGDPEKSVADAAAIKSDQSRFMALVGVANALALNGKRAPAREAADAALLLLDSGKLALAADIPAVSPDKLQATKMNLTQLASAAGSMMDDPMLSAPDLAAVLAKVGEGEAAAKLIEHCLNVVEASVPTRERDYAATGPNVRPLYAKYLLDSSGYMQLTFTDAAEVDFDAAAASARKLDSAVLRPQMLIAVTDGLNPPPPPDEGKGDGKDGGGASRQPAAAQPREMDVTQADIEVVRKAEAILSSPEKWNKASTQKCPADATTFGLYCAFSAASIAVTGKIDDHAPGIDEARRLIATTAPNATKYRARLVDYNNDPTVTLADLQKLLKAVENNLAKRMPSQE